MIEYENLQKTNSLFIKDFDKSLKSFYSSGWYVLGNNVSAFEKEYADRPHSRAAMVEELDNEYYFTEIKYSTVHWVLAYNNIDFFGDAFNPLPNNV